MATMVTVQQACGCDVPVYVFPNDPALPERLRAQVCPSCQNGRDQAARDAISAEEIRLAFAAPAGNDGETCEMCGAPEATADRFCPMSRDGEGAHRFLATPRLDAAFARRLAVYADDAAREV